MIISKVAVTSTFLKMLLHNICADIAKYYYYFRRTMQITL